MCFEESDLNKKGGKGTEAERVGERLSLGRYREGGRLGQLQRIASRYHLVRRSKLVEACVSTMECAHQR